MDPDPENVGRVAYTNSLDVVDFHALQGPSVPGAVWNDRENRVIRREPLKYLRGLMTLSLMAMKKSWPELCS